MQAEIFFALLGVLLISLLVVEQKAKLEERATVRNEERPVVLPDFIVWIGDALEWSSDWLARIVFLTVGVASLSYAAWLAWLS